MLSFANQLHNSWAIAAARPFVRK